MKNVVYSCVISFFVMRKFVNDESKYVKCTILNKSNNKIKGM